MGWTWDELHMVPQPVYEELIAQLVDEQNEARRGAHR